MTKQVTRREFLAISFAGLVGLFGLSAIIGLFSQSSSNSDELPGYGVGNYGP